MLNPKSNSVPPCPPTVLPSAPVAASTLPFMLGLISRGPPPVRASSSPPAPQLPGPAACTVLILTTPDQDWGPLARRPCPRKSCIYQIQFQFSLDAICISPSIHPILPRLPSANPPIHPVVPLALRPRHTPTSHQAEYLYLCLSRGHSGVTQPASLLPPPTLQPTPRASQSHFCVAGCRLGMDCAD